jgi:hypothetical protein
MLCDELWADRSVQEMKTKLHDRRMVCHPPIAVNLSQLHGLSQLSKVNQLLPIINAPSQRLLQPTQRYLRGLTTFQSKL